MKKIMMPSKYANENLHIKISGIMQPRLSASGDALPNARAVSLGLLSAPTVRHKMASMAIPTWFQFIYDDMVQLGSGIAPLHGKHSFVHRL
jgi:hypothetical protein